MTRRAGKGKTSWASDAIALLKRQIGWADALKGFEEDDAAWNANQGEVDLGDLIMGSEPDPT